MRKVAIIVVCVVCACSSKPAEQLPPNARYEGSCDPVTKHMVLWDSGGRRAEIAAAGIFQACKKGALTNAQVECLLAAKNVPEGVACGVPFD